MNGPDLGDEPYAEALHRGTGATFTCASMAPWYTIGDVRSMHVGFPGVRGSRRVRAFAAATDRLSGWESVKRVSIETHPRNQQGGMP
jgi:hypothetical protein